jgi:hypothetical protein
MNNEKSSRRNRCTICVYFCKFSFRRDIDKIIIIVVLAFKKENTNNNLCEKYLFEFLTNLSDKLDDQNKIDEHFNNSIFDDEDQINQTSCNGLTLMHVNILGGECAWCVTL